MSTATDRIGSDRKRSEWFWYELQALHERWGLLRHPFYVRWCAGELTSAELRIFAEEYDHLVIALATVATNAADKASEPVADLLQVHAIQEHEHVELWRAFATATGWSARSAWHYACDPAPATIECSRTWAGSPERSLALDLVTLHTVTSAQAEMAVVGVGALLVHYGFSDDAGSEYFRLHAEVDSRHAGLARWALDGPLLESEDPFALLTQAEAAGRGYWNVLDAIQEASA